MSETLRFIDDYSQRLGLMWKVRFAHAHVDRPQIISNEIDREHLLKIPMVYVARPIEEWRYEAVHEFIHAMFAEKIDPIFANVQFYPDYDFKTREVQDKTQMLYYSQQLIDVWVGDYMRKLNPQLVKEEVEGWLKAETAVPDEFYVRNPLVMIVSYAINEADIARGKIEGLVPLRREIRKRINRVLGKEATSVTGKLSAMFRNLPKLPLDKEMAIPLFQRQTRQTAQILKFPLTPTLIEHEGRWLWRF